MVVFFPSKKIKVVWQDYRERDAYIEYEYKRSPLIAFVGKVALPLEHLSPRLTGWNIFGKLAPIAALTQGKALISYKKMLVDYLTGSFTPAEESTYEKREVKVSLLYALGISYNFTDHFGVDLTYSGLCSRNKSKLTINSSGTYQLEPGVPSERLMAVGVTYRF